MLPQNLKYLRKKHHISQRDLAEAVELARSTIGDYERGRSEPDIKTLIRLTDYFKISLDDLILKDLKKEDYEIIRNKDFRVLAITVNKDEKENIELVNTKAEAGYIEGFNDPEYVRDLPKLYFPNIPEGTYRAFEIHGDSMLPMEPGSIVICSYVENMLDIKNGKTYVVVSKSGGLVYKRVQLLSKENALLMISDNDIYSPYVLPMDDVAEIWKYYAAILVSDPKNLIDSMIDEKIEDIYKKVGVIYEKII